MTKNDTKSVSRLELPHPGGVCGHTVDLLIFLGIYIYAIIHLLNYQTVGTLPLVCAMILFTLFTLVCAESIREYGWGRYFKDLISPYATRHYIELFRDDPAQIIVSKRFELLRVTFTPNKVFASQLLSIEWQKSYVDWIVWLRYLPEHMNHQLEQSDRSCLKLIQISPNLPKQQAAEFAYQLIEFMNQNGIVFRPSNEEHEFITDHAYNLLAYDVTK